MERTKSRIPQTEDTRPALVDQVRLILPEGFGLRENWEKWHKQCVRFEFQPDGERDFALVAGVETEPIRARSRAGSRTVADANGVTGE